MHPFRGPVSADGGPRTQPREASVTQHAPLRPAWTCVADGEPWPCPGARLRLWSDYAGDPTRLAVYMSTLLMTAAADTGSRGALPPELFNRFMAWTAR